MSRRISLFVLAASAVLIVSPASADRECFENSCRLPGVVEPPPQADPPAEPQASAAPDDAQPAMARRFAPPKLVPSKPVPSVVAIEARQERNADATAVVEIKRSAPHAIRAERAPASHHPYGAYAGSPVYLVAPDAKIIVLDAGD